MKKALVVSVIVLMCGCSSTFRTSKFDTETWQPKGNQVEGLIYYEPQQMLITYKFTAFVDNGEFIGTSDNSSCVEVIQKQELVIEPNFNDPQVIINVPSAFSSNRLTVSLSNGMITSINTESTPKIPEIIKEFTTLGKEAGLLAVKGIRRNPPCNTSPMIRSKVPYKNM